MARWQPQWLVVVGLWGCIEGNALDQALTGQGNPTPAVTTDTPDQGPDAAPLDGGGACVPDAPCGAPAVGVCAPGRQLCVEGEAPRCMGERGPQAEICDTLDNDCDGQVDEVDCPSCRAGEAQPCFSGLEGVLNVGPCRAGQQACGADGRFGVCEGEVVPLGETCNGADDDCDGTTDEGFEVGAACQAGVGQCATDGVVLCSAGGMRCSAQALAPEPEQCNAIDDDCDGTVDEDFALGEPCSAGVGACRRQAERICGDVEGLCQAAPGVPDGETCNGIDDDCDGATDEGLLPCYSGPDGTAGMGRCRRGRRLCADIECVGEVLPLVEACNGADDDCDGSTDENLNDCRCMPGERVGCYEGPGEPGFGICTEGSRLCGAGGAFGPCTGVIGPRAEDCNGLDDNCDGSVDEGLVRACGQVGGRCREGQQRCLEGRWGACDGSVGPQAESCNAVDDDCDGSTDEGVSRACGTDEGACVAGQQACQNGVFGGCAGGVSPMAEGCNRQDDDCDSRIDEGTQNACGGCGPVAAEQCNGVDDDCDGGTDEGLANCRPCNNDGQCADGNPCTDDLCRNGQCIIQPNDAPCDDGNFCNGADRCLDRQCIRHDNPVACPRFCSDAEQRCIDCLGPPDCPVQPTTEWSECFGFAGECGRDGVQVRQVFSPTCEGGTCGQGVQEEQRPCTQETDGQRCGGGVCLDGRCAALRTLTARSTGRLTAEARARVACDQTGVSCVSEGVNHPCEIQCPEGAVASVCCSNGSACGGNPSAPNFNRVLADLSIDGLDALACGGLGFEQADCTGRVAAGPANLLCFFDLDNGGIPP